MKYNFAGKCFVEVSGEGIEIDSFEVIGDHLNITDDIELHYLDLKDDEEIKKLGIGQYHVFFYGVYEWVASEDWEYGTVDYDLEFPELEIVITNLSAKEK